MDKTTSALMICYYRLSLEDGDVARGNAAESFSISAQRLCVQNFLASRPDLDGTVEEIVDDGYTGTNMNRPGMQRLLSLVKSGSVKAVIVRDLSRFSRSFLEGGHYLEFVFPAYGVRFISINDHFDSADYGESTGGLELGITNLLNQLYSRDLSRKIKSVTDRKKLMANMPLALYLSAIKRVSRRTPSWSIHLPPTSSDRYFSGPRRASASHRSRSG